MAIHFVDLKQQYKLLKKSIDTNIQSVLDHGQYILGPEVKELEDKLAEFCGSKHCIACASGTDALLIALMALSVGAGDEVITTPFTFIATGEMIALAGAKPVFIDIDEKTFNLDPHLLEDAITPRTRAIMPVSLFGQCADMDSINRIATKHGIPVIEDAAQSFGATFKGGKSCALSTIGCTSFFPSKPLGCYGDGGACFTDDPAIASRMTQIRIHGQDRRYHHPVLGINGRLHTLQAAILLAKLEVFPEEIEARQKIAGWYSHYLNGKVDTPHIARDNTSVFAQYTIQVDNRARLQERLAAAGIPTAVHYPQPLHLQLAFAGLGFSVGSFPVSEQAAKRVLSLPIHPYLTEDEVNMISSTVVRGVEQ